MRSLGRMFDRSTKEDVLRVLQGAIPAHLVTPFNAAAVLAGITAILLYALKV